ncbi:MAG: serine dehydratase [Planctomycetes bacterium]|nr:serine dehydratase [Planctomycetota bacterium]
MAIPASIFNDVIGPVMRGPSSSHCAAALRIGRLARDLMGGDIAGVTVEFDEHGSLATTHTSQGSDMGLFGGLMGLDATDERLVNSAKDITEAGINIDVRICNFHDPHPNTYRLKLSNAGEIHSLTAISTGGGMIEVTEINGIATSMIGDYFETLIYVSGESGNVVDTLKKAFENDEILVHDDIVGKLIEIRADRFISEELAESIRSEHNIRYIKRLAPVLPVLSRKETQVPFSNYEEMLQYDAAGKMPLWELAVNYESERGGIAGDEVLARMVEIVKTVRVSVKQGIAGTNYQDRILGFQCGRFKERLESGSLLEAGIMNKIVIYVTALMEVKSAMGVIVAAPTAGSCGALPGACLAAADSLGLADEDAAKAMLAGGLIGVFIAEASTFAAEEAGCQAECGSASGMAAAALVNLAGGSAKQAIAAASMALQNSLGMVCDPVASRVEVPCLGKNVMAAVNALSCANMAIAGYDPVIWIDEVIDAMDRVGRSLPREVRCTALGGLSITKTSKDIELSLKKNTEK